MSQFLKKRGGAVLITLGNGPLNTLSHNVRVDLMHNLERAKAENASAVVIMGEGQHFSAGPDFKEFARGLQASPSVREIVSYLDTYPTHIIAGMHGVAFSSAFETALACHWRIANESATFGLPDVTVGKIPGAGGTQRFPRLVAAEKAATLISSGDIISSSNALSLGIIDEIVTRKSPDDLLEASINLALSDKVQGTLVSDRRVSNMSVKGVIGSAVSLDLDELSKKTGNTMILSVYEAIKAAVSAGSFEEGMEEELRILTKLSSSKEVKAIQYFFFNERRFDKKDIGDQMRVPKSQKFFLHNERQGNNVPSEFQLKSEGLPFIWTENSMAIMGGGPLAVKIAETFASADLSPLMIEDTEEKCNTLSTIIEKHQKDATQQATIFKNPSGVISCTSNLSELKKADYVIDVSTSDNIDDKRKNFQVLDEMCDSKAIIAINLGTSNIDQIVGNSSRAHNVIGTNFFHKRNLRRFAEVIPGKMTSNESIRKYLELLGKLRKYPIFIGNSTGYLVNKLFEPCVQEALHLLEEGVPLDHIDRILVKRLGLRKGPFNMLDSVELSAADINVTKLKIEERFKKYQIELLTPIEEKPKLKKQPSTLPEDVEENKVIVIKAPVILSNWHSDILEKMHAAGLKGLQFDEGGKCTGSGFYNYGTREFIRNPDAMVVIERHRADMNIVQRFISDDEIFERCYYALVNEAFNLLEDGSLQSPDDVDLIYIRGLGLSPHLGGLLYHAEHGIGLPKIYKALKGHHENLYERPWFKPSQLLVSVVESQASLKEEMYFRKLNKKDEINKKK